jgi:hypothetical protein
VWVYYSAQIFVFGADFTRVYSDAHATADVRAGREPMKTKPEVSIEKQATVHSGTVTQPANFATNPPKMRAAPAAASTYSLDLKSRPSLLAAGILGFLFGRIFAMKSRRS